MQGTLVDLRQDRTGAGRGAFQGAPAVEAGLLHEQLQLHLAAVERLIAEDVAALNEMLRAPRPGP